MNGILLLLKSMGFDPDDFKAKVVAASQALEEWRVIQVSFANKLNKILENQTKIMAALNIAEETENAKPGGTTDIKAINGPH